MSKTVIAIDPVTRLEGHLKVEVQVEDGKVADAWITGGMFRGFEAILRGRNPRDASQIVQRICGVCPVAHATASSLAIEAVCGVEVPENGRIARNLMLAGNYLQSNILHFYHLGGQDYFHGPDTVPFIPRYRNPDLRLSEEQNTLAMDEYIEALEVRQVCHQLVALFGGRMPHLQGILGGGAAQIPDRETILEYAARMKQVRKFVENRYLPLVYTIASRYMDMFEMAHGYKNALCVGVFPLAKKGEQFFNAGAYINGRDEPFDGYRILEDVRYSWFEPAPSGTPLQKSESNPQVDKDTLLKESDFLSLHCPLSDLSRNFIDKEAFRKMKKTAVLINVARGPVVNNSDLYEALVAGEIQAAGLDVLEKEPLELSNPLSTLKDSNKLIITPHLAWASVEARTRCVQGVYENIKAFMRGENRNVVNL